MSPCRDPATGGWAALPRDLLVDVFLKIGPREIMLGAEFACHAWRRAALEEPSLWRRVGRDPIDTTWRCVGIAAEKAMRSAAVDRAAGHCEEFTGSCDDEDLIPLVQRAPSLKSLDIQLYRLDYDDDYDHSSDVLVEALKKLTLLEDLQIYFHYSLISDENTLQSVCQACPQLKKLVMIYASSIELELDEDLYGKEPVDEPIPLMRNLHTLELDDVDLTCEGLNAILDSCPLLQTLTIHGYFDMREMDKQLRMKCARVKNLTLPESVKHEDDIYYDY